MDRIDKSPVLKKAFQDPRFLTISQQLARDPLNTMKMVSERHPEYLEALKEFSGLLGEVMEQKAEEQEKPKLDPFEQGLVDNVMKDIKIQARVSKIDQIGSLEGPKNSANAFSIKK
jgi:hypothetical protein